MVPDRKGVPLSHFAVIADAVTSPYQAAMRAEVKPGDLTIVTGCREVRMPPKICSALGAKEVIGIAPNPAKLKRALDYGATHVISSIGKTPRDIKDEFRNYCKEKGMPSNYGWKIFEWTGTADGQAIALELLSFIGKLLICGFGMQKNEYSLSRLMAFDADILGSWGCLPKYYPAVLDMMLKGKIKIEPFIETRPMSQIQQAFEDAHGGRLEKRIILTPDF